MKGAREIMEKFHKVNAKEGVEIFVVVQHLPETKQVVRPFYSADNL